MKSIFTKFPIFYISGWYAAFAAIVAIPIALLLTVNNPEDQDLWVKFPIISIFSGGVWGAASAFFYLKNGQIITASRSTMVGAAVAILSLLLLGPLVSLFGDVNTNNITDVFLAGFGLFPTVLLIVGWVVIPVGMLAGYLLPKHIPKATNKLNSFVVMPTLGLIIMLVGLIFISIPKGMLYSTTLYVEEAKWSRCCKWVHGYAHQADIVIELGFFNSKEKLRGVHVVYIQPGLIDYLEQYPEMLIKVTLEVKSFFGKKTGYRITKIQDFELKKTAYYPSQVLRGVIEADLDDIDSNKSLKTGTRE